MFGQMQDVPLLMNRILDHAMVNHSEREIVSRLVEGNIHRETYAELHLRARKLSQALKSLGMGEQDVIATLAWNTHRHIEAWYGITGIGGVYHTLNPRLFAEQLVYIINHAEDKLIFTDLTFVPVLEGIADQIAQSNGDHRVRSAHQEGVANVHLDVHRLAPDLIALEVHHLLDDREFHSICGHMHG